MTILKSLVELLKPAFIIVVIMIAVATYLLLDYRNKSINLIKDEGWLHFPGAEITNEGIFLKPLGRVIVHQDGSVGQPNPPVNLVGQHIKVKGDFRITAVLTKINRYASLRLYSSPPIVYDQWRKETPSIDINIDTVNNLVVSHIWDGNSNTSLDERTYKVFLPSTVTISLEHIKNQINIIEDDHLLFSMPDHNIFYSETVWFGTDGAVGSAGWTLVSLNAKAIGAGTVEIISAPILVVDQNDPNSLRNLADANARKIKIGAAVALEPLLIDQQYRDLALSQFSIITPENSMKPEFIHPQPSMYDFSKADSFVDVALKNKILVHGHALIYSKSTSGWMTDSLKGKRQEIMVSHIENVVGHFAGKVAEWDVVNELLGGAGLDPNIWFEAMGEKYIDLAFNIAHKTDPSAKLYLNDYGLENNGQRWDALLSLVKRLKERKVPIDGVGFEAHVYGNGDYINSDQLKKHMEILDKLGLSARISEIDVTGDNPQEQINQYVIALDACLLAPNCTSYTTWGVTDLYGSTTRSDRYPLVYGSSLIWDKNMKAKPVFGALQNRLKK